MQTTYTCIRPTYLRDFRCDGPSCQSRCCGNWRITIDPDALQRYSHMEPKEEGQAILSHIIYRKETQSFGISMRADYRCPFLDDDYLCKLQKRYGEEYLADICVAYPRVTYHVDELLEQSLAITCPVAAKRILLSDSPIRFEKAEIPYPRKSQVIPWTKKVLHFPDQWQQLQKMGVRLLQEDGFSLNQRFLRLLLFLEQVDRMRPEDVPVGLDAMEENGFALLDSNLPLFFPNQHVLRMAKLFSQLYRMDLTIEKVVSLQKAYTENRKELLPRILEIYHRPLENYLVNEFFLRFYPFAYEGSLLYNGKLFIMGSKLLEFSLLLTAVAHQGILEEQDFLQIVDRIAERLDHSRDGMTFLRDSIPKETSSESALEFAANMIG